MKQLAYIALLLSLFSCATWPAPRGGENRSEQVQLCITNQSGSVVHVFTSSGRKVGTTPRPNGGCILLPWDISTQAEPSALCVTTLGMSRWCEALPYAVYANSPVWSLWLGPHTNTWHFDVQSLQPGTAAS